MGRGGGGGEAGIKGVKEGVQIVVRGLKRDLNEHLLTKIFTHPIFLLNILVLKKIYNETIARYLKSYSGLFCFNGIFLKNTLKINFNKL